jgi:two-component system, CitB family, sensor kinase
VYGGMSRDLTTVVGNLVDNALDAAASADEPRVDVRLVEDGAAIVVSVSDTGPGVSDTEEVFRQGYTTKANGHSSDGGRGFGLALTRLVCRRRGGDVTVCNGEPGLGAVFTATLPVNRDEVTS